MAQATGTAQADIQYLLYDGHGSTRQLVNYDGTIVDDSFSFDAYGVLLGGERATQTSLLYTGEQYDTSAEMYYLRARYYDPLNGRFNQTDPYAGSTQDPQSLHKYLYAHGNPVNGIDPSGNYLISLVMMIAGVLAYGIMYGVYLWNYHSSKKNNIRSKFDAWYKRQTDGWWTILPKCPCNIMVKDGKPSYNGKDRIYWHAPREPRHQEERLHPGITFSLRSIIFNSQSNQCTYDTRGKLLTEPPSAGTVDFRVPGLPWGFFMPHLYADVYPLHWAVYIDHNIEMHVNYGPKTPKDIRKYMKKYYEKRPLHHNNCPRNALGSRG